MLIVNERISIPLEEIGFEYARSGGPGGQNVNKVNSKTTLRWLPAQSVGLPPAVRDRFLKKYASRLTKEGEILITSQRTRDQSRNTDDCLEKLKQLLLDVALPPTPRRPTKPTLGSKTRRIETKSRRSETKKSRQKPSLD